jgi:endonuclease/exonuclease/phosphatase (EEP) superfamily protein YafD
MPAAESPDAPPSHWRCDRCGTPNRLTADLTHCVGCGAARPRSELATAGDPPAEVLSSPREGARILVRPRRGRWVEALSWAYALTVLAALALIRFRGDVWWPATELMFLPRWAWLVPLPALAEAAGWVRRPSLWTIQGASALVVAGPLMNLSLPIERLWGDIPAGTRVRVMTFNQGAGRPDVDGLLRLIERERVEVVCLQEGGSPKGLPDPVVEALLARGWSANEERTILTRLPIVAELGPLDVEDGDYSYWKARLSRARLRAGRDDEFVVASAHLPSMFYAFAALRHGDMIGFRQHMTWRWRQMLAVAQALRQTSGAPLIVGGDFNTPADSPLMDLLRMAGLRPAFEEAGWGYGYTRPALGIGLDQVLASPDCTVTRCRVGPDLGSDHRPVIAEVALPPPMPGGRAGSR